MYYIFEKDGKFYRTVSEDKAKRCADRIIGWIWGFNLDSDLPTFKEGKRSG